MLFTDTITFYHKNDEDAYERIVIKGVQWSDRTNKTNIEGVISIARYVVVTFPEGTYEGLALSGANEEDAMFLGEITDEVTAERGHRISNLLETYPKSGRIKEVNDNSMRDKLKNIKVILA